MLTPLVPFVLDMDYDRSDTLHCRKIPLTRGSDLGRSLNRYRIMGRVAMNVTMITLLFSAHEKASLVPNELLAISRLSGESMHPIACCAHKKSGLVWPLSLVSELGLTSLQNSLSSTRLKTTRLTSRCCIPYCVSLLPSLRFLRSSYP